MPPAGSAIPGSGSAKGDVMGLQIIEFRTSAIDVVRKVDQEWRDDLDVIQTVPGLS
jgi:hypothetical protein